jgi:hypothetical protein
MFKTMQSCFVFLSAACCGQVLQGVDAILVFADGSTLLHEAVDLATGDGHLQVLLDAVLGSMTPADLMAQNSADRQFLNHMHQGKTALFKVRWVLLALAVCSGCLGFAVFAAVGCCQSRLLITGQLL